MSLSRSPLRFWTGPLPPQELFPDREVNPWLHWFIHPVKRRIAKYYVFLLQQVFGLKVIALTGSTGKTTTTSLLYSVLSQTGATVRTAESITTTYNLPTTILKCTPGTRYLILEMGVEYIGDMDFYCWLVRPDISLVLNVTAVHAHFFGTVENIRTEKEKLLKKSKVVVTSADYPTVASSRITPELKTEIRLVRQRRTLLVQLPLIGTQYSANVAAVIAVADKLHIQDPDLIAGLESVSPPAHRFSLSALPGGSLLIDDTYNANPLSVAAALETVVAISSLKDKVPVVVLGQMNELGRYEKTEHEKIGSLIRKLGIRHLYCIGPATRYTVAAAGYGTQYNYQHDILAQLNKLFTLNRQWCILVKGSRSWHLENLIPSLLDLNLV